MVCCEDCVYYECFVHRTAESSVLMECCGTIGELEYGEHDCVLFVEVSRE